MGMVMEPEPTVLATELPEAMPSSAEAMTATLAGPPEAEPATKFAHSMKKFAMPVLSRKEPKMTKTTMNYAQTFIGVERMPLTL